MKLIHYYFFSIVCLSAFLPQEARAAYTVKDGKLVNKNEMATHSVQEHYSFAMEAYQKKKWGELVKQATIVIKNFPTTPFAQEAVFYLAVGYFHEKDFELANREFANYLKKQATPKHFEEAIQYKFAIAEKFHKGAKRHLMGWESLPKWAPAREEALAIYDEVITALPHHDLGAQALFGKARLLFKDEDYKASVETYQTLIRRFPKHALATESYLGVADVYLTQCQAEYPDPDFLDLAEINLRKFRQDFPGDEQVESADKKLRNMKEIYARSWYETAQFFERTKKPHASIIYYTKVVAVYPDTECATLARKRLEALQKHKKVAQQETLETEVSSPEEQTVN